MDFLHIAQAQLTFSIDLQHERTYEHIHEVTHEVIHEHIHGRLANISMNMDMQAGGVTCHEPTC